MSESTGVTLGEIGQLVVKGLDIHYDDRWTICP